MLVLQVNVVSYRLDEGRGCSIHKRDESRDEECHCGLNVDLDSVTHKHESLSEEGRGCSIQIGNESSDEKCHCGLNVDLDSVTDKYESLSDMLLLLKTVAIDPSFVDASSKKFQESRQQILFARRVLTLSNGDCPQKKRKLDELLRQKVVVDYSSSSKKPSVQNSGERDKCSLATSSSCLISHADSAESSDQILPGSARSIKFGNSPSRHWVRNPCLEYDELDLTSPSNKEHLSLLDSDDSVSCSLSSIEPDLQMPQRAFKLLKTGDVRKVPSSPKNGGSFIYNPDGLASKTQRKHQKPHRSAKLSNFGDYIPEMVIPIGPRFQADIPDWTGPSNMGISLNGEVKSDDSEKWLGTRIWPVKGKRAEISTELIGKGRPCLCSCEYPGSTKCIKHHISEKRLQLKLDLGSAFFSWRFNEMGEQISKSWKIEDQKNFEVLVKMNPLSKNTSFWKPALKCFPYKSRESLVSYYYNVFVLRRMSRLTRLASALVDSDDDEANENVGSCKNSKVRYLTGLR